MISDHLMAMCRDGLLKDVQDDKLNILIKEEDPLQMIPNVVVEAKPSKVIDNAMFIVNVAMGSAPHSKYSVLKTYDFPPLNRNQPITRKDLKKYLKRYRNHTPYQRFANFMLLIYVSREMDIDVSLRTYF